MANRQLASSSAHKRTTAGSSMEMLHTEGSNFLITEEGRKQVPNGGSFENVLTGVPRKLSLNIPQSSSHRITSSGGLERVGSDESEDEDTVGVEDDESGEEEDSEVTPEQILQAAGVDMAMFESVCCDERHCAPLELLTEFLSCVMREKYEAAKLLCEKVLQLEPTNHFAIEYLPVIVERLQINIDQSPDQSDSSSDGDASSDDSHTSSDGGYHTHQDHTPHPNKTTPTQPHHC